MDVVTSFPAFFCDYVHGLLVMPNIIYVGVIALFFGIVTARFPGVIFVPVVAAIVYLAAQAVIPPLLHHGEIVMPAFNLALVKQAVALYVVFLVVDTIIFAIKKAILAITG
jgi:hypothetical protein